MHEQAAEDARMRRERIKSDVDLIIDRANLAASKRLKRRGVATRVGLWRNQYGVVGTPRCICGMTDCAGCQHDQIRER